MSVISGLLWTKLKLENRRVSVKDIHSNTIQIN